MNKEWQHCPYRVNDPLENIPYDLSISEFKRYCEPVNPSAFIIAPGGEYKKPKGGCRLIQTIATSRAFNRYRGLYTMQTLDDMVQEAFLGMMLYKDDFTGEPKEIIFKAIRKHFKIMYREANGVKRDFDNGKHNARIVPKQSKPKLLIDELDYDPDKEPESVKQANNIKNWRIGGISKGYKGIIHFYDEEQDEYRTTRTCPKKHKIIKTDDPGYVTAIRIEKGIENTITYKRTQIKAAAKKLIIESDKPFTKKRNDPLELVNLLHSGFYPDYQFIKSDYIHSDYFTAAPWNNFSVCFFCSTVLPSIIQDTEIPGSKKKLFFPPLPPSRNADTAIKQYITEQCQPPQQWVKDGLSYYSSMDRRAVLILILKEVLAVINTMQQPQAFITKLYYYQGLTQAEISALLHRSNRKVQLAREAGLEEIKQHFTKHYSLMDIESIIERVRKQILNREILPI